MLTIVKYILIVLLSIGLYLTWKHKEELASTNKKLKEKITLLKNELYHKKNINLVFPKDEKDFTKSSDQKLNILNLGAIPYEKTSSNNASNQTQIKPEVLLDEQNRKIEAVKIQVETKF